MDKNYHKGLSLGLTIEPSIENQVAGALYAANNIPAIDGTYIAYLSDDGRIEWKLIELANEEEMNESDLEIAERHHRLWRFWMETLLLEIEENKDGSMTIPAEKVKEIREEISAKYEDLSRQQKAIYEGTAAYEIQDTRSGIDW